MPTRAQISFVAGIAMMLSSFLFLVALIFASEPSTLVREVAVQDAVSDLAARREIGGDGSEPVRRLTADGHANPK